MRNNNQKRMRGRNNNHHRKSQNPLTRVYESNGPDVKIRGTANHIAEKYIQLARDAQGSGDPVAAENYYQHAEHYFRLIAAAQEQFRQQNPHYNQQQPGGQPQQGAADDAFDDGDDDQPGQTAGGQNEPYSPREQPQPFVRDNQQFQPREGHQQHQGNRQNYNQRPRYNNNDGPRHNNNDSPRYNEPVRASEASRNEAPRNNEGQQDVGGLPSFITGGGAPQQDSQPPSYGQPNGQSAHEQGQERGDNRFGRHRRRRHRGPRDDAPDQMIAGGDAADQAGE